jgi:endonuclease G
MNNEKKITDYRIEIANGAYKEWADFQKNSGDRNIGNLDRLNSFYKREINKSKIHDPNYGIATERLVGPTNDLKDFAPYELARKKGKPVCRIHEIVPGVQPSGFGTGFLIAQNLLLTNYHVFPSKQHSENCAANFLHEKDSSGRILEGIRFKLRPDIFFYNYEDLDFAIVFVESNPIEGNGLLNDLGVLNLIETKGKIIEGRPISIIQYPLGGHKRYAYENNFVTAIEDKIGVIQYTTDTLPASSGSPAFNTSWEVVALHYTSIPCIVDGKWRTRTGEIWDRETMSEEDVFWIGNAGKSVSKIISYLRTLKLSTVHQKYIDQIVKNSADPVNQNESNDGVVFPQNMQNNYQNPINNAMEKINLNFTGPVNIYINQTAPQPAPMPNLNSNEVVDELLQEKPIRFDEDYDNREGYNEDFLDDFKVPIPIVIQTRQSELFKKFGTNEPYILKYYHYSLVMNKERRMLMWAASNVNYSTSVRDGRSRKSLGEDSKAWRTDPRIPEKYQIQAAEFYDPATLVDKGHMVRRDDNVWYDGADALKIEYSNSDTFHWTNCTPQHEEFNRDMFGVKGLWGILENEIKKQLNDENDANKDYNQKACVLSGPVLDKNDPSAYGIQYPYKFWKVFAINSVSKGKLVYGFILSQENKVLELGLEKEGLPRFNATVKKLQASLTEIEELAGIKFHDDLHQWDVKR